MILSTSNHPILYKYWYVLKPVNVMVFGWYHYFLFVHTIQENINWPHLIRPILLIFVMQSVKTCQMSQNAKLSFWSHFKATSEPFPELLKFCLDDIRIPSYNYMMLSSSVLSYTSFLTISNHFSKCHFATSNGFSQIASHLSIAWE